MILQQALRRCSQTLPQAGGPSGRLSGRLERSIMGERKSIWRRLPALLDPAEVLHILEGDDEAARLRLAARPDATPEALYYLATQGSAEARRAVAANEATPPHAN